MTATRLCRREPGTSKPHPAQIRAVWGWLSILRHHVPDDARYEGAVAAAEWLIGLSNVPPVTARAFRHPQNLVDAAFVHPGDDETIKPATTAGLAAEINDAADEARYAQTTAARAYAAGAHALMCWWADVERLPADMTPDDRGRLPQRQQADVA